MADAQWSAFLIAATLVAITPGANQLLALRNALQQGTGDAVVALAGRFTAFLLLIAATVSGLGALLLASETAFTIVKWCGVAYLLYLGGRMVLHSRAPTDQAERRAERLCPARDEHRRGRWLLARQEFSVAMTNPKAMLLFAAFLPQFTDPSAGTTVAQLLALGAAYIGVEFLAALVYTGVGGRLAGADLTAHTRRLLDRVSGLTMVGIAGWLALERR